LCGFVDLSCEFLHDVYIYIFKIDHVTTTQIQDEYLLTLHAFSSFVEIFLKIQFEAIETLFFF
jgi:hypothetical protein